MESDKVIHNSESNPQQVQYKEIESTNHNACNLLVARGYKGDKLKVELKKLKAKDATVTVPNSPEEVQTMADCKSYGHKFLQKGADHSCTDMLFKALTLKGCRARRDVMKKDRVAQEAAAKIAKDAKSILDHPPPKLLGHHYQTLLLYHEIPRKNHGKTVGEAKANYMKLKDKNSPPKEVKEWTRTSLRH